MRLYTLTLTIGIEDPHQHPRAIDYAQLLGVPFAKLAGFCEHELPPGTPQTIGVSGHESSVVKGF